MEILRIGGISVMLFELLLWWICGDRLIMCDLFGDTFGDMVILHFSWYTAILVVVWCNCLKMGGHFTLCTVRMVYCQLPGHNVDLC